MDFPLHPSSGCTEPPCQDAPRPPRPAIATNRTSIFGSPSHLIPIRPTFEPSERVSTPSPSFLPFSPIKPMCKHAFAAITSPNHPRIHLFYFVAHQARSRLSHVDSLPNTVVDLCFYTSVPYQQGQRYTQRGREVGHSFSRSTHTHSKAPRRFKTFQLTHTHTQASRNSFQAALVLTLNSFFPLFFGFHTTDSFAPALANGFKVALTEQDVHMPCSLAPTPCLGRAPLANPWDG